MSVTHVDGFEENWQAKILPGQPMIMPARHIVLPQAVPGEEDALARGALWLEIKPLPAAAQYVVQCAMGFAGSGVATGVWSTPAPETLLAVAGGYAYRIDTAHPHTGQLLEMRPVVSVYPAPGARALVLVGFHAVMVLGEAEAWQSPRLSWEGVSITGIEGDLLHGTGWHMRTDREVPFTLNLRTKELMGGGFTP